MEILTGGASTRGSLAVSSVFIALSFAVVVPVLGQDNVTLEVTSFQVDPGAGRDRYVRVGFRSNLPEDSSVTFKIAFESEPIPELWMGGYLEPGGKATVEIGPLEKQFLPGVYEVILVVDPQEQNPDNAEFWSRFSRAFERVSQRRMGSEQEEKQLRAQYRAPLHAQVVAIEKAIEEIVRYEDEIKRGADGRFFPEGKFAREEFTEWADGIVDALQSLERFYLAIPTEYYVPYYAGAYKYLLPSVWTNARYALVDYTIFPVFERERKKAETRGEGFVVPERFHPLKGGTVRPPREVAFQIAARDLLNVRRMIGEAPAQPPLAGYVPTGNDVPSGFVIGPIPEDLRSILDQNPAEHARISGSGKEALAAVLGGFDIPGRMDLSGIYYCLTPEPPKDGKGTVDPASRVLVLVLRFPDEVSTSIPLMELQRTDRPRAVKAKILGAKETIALIVTGPDDVSKAAGEELETWLRSRHAFGDIAGKFGVGRNGGGR